jgi:hypothetical protein
MLRVIFLKQRNLVVYSIVVCKYTSNERKLILILSIQLYIIFDDFVKIINLKIVLRYRNVAIFQLYKVICITF